MAKNKKLTLNSVKGSHRKLVINHIINQLAMTDFSKMRSFAFSLILVTCGTVVPGVRGDTHDHSAHTDHTGQTNVQTIEAYNEVDSGDNLKFSFLIRF